MKQIIAMILAGGRVDELSVLTLYRPKAAVPFGGLYRVIDFPLSNLMHAGIENAGILSQYRSVSLINHIGSGTAWDMVGSQRGISILPPMQGTRRSDWYKGTADAVYQNMEYIESLDPEYVLILSGDHIYQMDYLRLLRFHQRVEADVTIAFVRVPGKGSERFGQGVIEEGSDREGGRLLRYVEKPSQSISPWASMTIYLFNRPALDFIMDEKMTPPSTEHFGRDIFPVLLEEKKVFGYRFEGSWAYTRTIDEYWEANMALLSEQPHIDPAAWGVRTNLDNERIRDRAPTIFHPDAHVRRSLIHSGCTIHGSVDNSILFPGCRIETGAVVENSILMYNTRVGEGAKVNGVIADVEAVAGAHSHVGWGESRGPNIEYPDLLRSGLTVVGRNTRIPPRYRIGRNSIIYPNKFENDFPEEQLDHGRTLK